MPKTFSLDEVEKKLIVTGKRNAGRSPPNYCELTDSMMNILNRNQNRTTIATKWSTFHLLRKKKIKKKDNRERKKSKGKNSQVRNLVYV